MKVALLSAGPSISTLWTEERKHEFDLVVALNCAGWLFDCDWMVAAHRHGLVPWLGGSFAGTVPDPRAPEVEEYEGMTRPAPRIGFAVPPELLPVVTPRYFDRLVTRLPWPNQERTKEPYTIIPAFRMCRLLSGEDGEVHVFGWDCTVGVRDVCNQAGHFHATRWVREIQGVKPMWRPQDQVFGRMAAGLKNTLKRGNTP